MSKRFYLTTAIDYVNGEPHLGHAYEKVITDIIARTHRSLGQEVFYLTGLDEHGQKVQTAAKADGKDPQAYCDDFAGLGEVCRPAEPYKCRLRPHIIATPQSVCQGSTAETV